jgi:hypothetical protein
MKKTMAILMLIIGVCLISQPVLSGGFVSGASQVVLTATSGIQKLANSGDIPGSANGATMHVTGGEILYLVGADMNSSGVTLTVTSGVSLEDGESVEFKMREELERLEYVLGRDQTGATVIFTFYNNRP